MKRYLFVIVFSFLFINCDFKKENNIDLSNNTAGSDFTFSTWTSSGNNFNKLGRKK